MVHVTVIEPFASSPCCRDIDPERLEPQGAFVNTHTMELPITDALTQHPYFRECPALSESHESSSVSGPDVLIEAGELMEAIDRDTDASAAQRRDAKSLLNFVAPNKSESPPFRVPKRSRGRRSMRERERGRGARTSASCARRCQLRA